MKSGRVNLLISNLPALSSLTLEVDEIARELLQLNCLQLKKGQKAIPAR